MKLKALAILRIGWNCIGLPILMHYEWRGKVGDWTGWMEVDRHGAGDYYNGSD